MQTVSGRDLEVEWYDSLRLVSLCLQGRLWHCIALRNAWSNCQCDWQPVNVQSPFAAQQTPNLGHQCPFDWPNTPCCGSAPSFLANVSCCLPFKPSSPTPCNG
eukprot:m.112509 g.112509  ORF g.112509 m.112509 type:complete len:103 (+) comp15412_c0_seq2:180-488(+)